MYFFFCFIFVRFVVFKLLLNSNFLKYPEIKPQLYRWINQQIATVKQAGRAGSPQKSGTHISNELNSQLAALSVQAAAKSNFKGCIPYKSAQYPEPGQQAGSTSLPQSPVLQSRQQAPASSNVGVLSVNSKQITTTHGSSGGSSGGMIAPSSILAAVRSLAANNNGPKSESNSSGCGDNKNPSPSENTASTNAQSSQAVARQNRRLGRHESRYTSGKQYFFFENIFCAYELTWKSIKDRSRLEK